MANTKTPKKATKKSGNGNAEKKVPTSRQVADLLGVELTPALKPEQISRLRKALPGYVGMLDDVAVLLQQDAGVLNLPDVTPEDLLEAQAQQKHLAAREAVAYGVYRSLFEQRLLVDDRSMKMLEKIARRVKALQEDDREMPARWKLLLDFLGTFHASGSRKAAPAGAPAEA